MPRLFTAPTRQLELDHLEHADQEYIIYLPNKDLDHEVGMTCRRSGRGVSYFVVFFSPAMRLVKCAIERGLLSFRIQ